MAAKPKLDSIQALRGIAAVAVILYHVARHLDRAQGTPTLMRLFQAGHAGVDLFFVLSGFIILFVHGRDIGQPARLAYYTRQRLVRVWPIYWVALAATVLLGILGAAGWPDPAQLAWSATLLPSRQPPLLGIAWSLRFEIIFYAIFALLILHRRLGLTALAAWLAAILFLPAAAAAPGALALQLREPFNLHFFLGMAVALATRRAVPWPGIIAAAGLALLVATGIAESLGRIDGYATLARLLYGPAAALLILGLVGRERTAGMAVPALLVRLGGASYSLYLFQFIFIGIAWKLWVAAGLDRALPVAATFLALSAAAIVGGMLVAAIVERPLMRRLAPRRHSEPRGFA